MYLLNLACYCILNFLQVYIYHYSLQYYYKSLKEIINYIRNPIQFQGGTKIFYIYTITTKKFYIYFVLKKYWQVLAIFTDTTSRYHKNRPIPTIPILQYRYITRKYHLYFTIFINFCLSEVGSNYS